MTGVVGQLEWPQCWNDSKRGIVTDGAVIDRYRICAFCLAVIVWRLSLVLYKCVRKGTGAEQPGQQTGAHQMLLNEEVFVDSASADYVRLGR